MDAYTSFAEVYDLFMDNVPYDEWCTQIIKILEDHGISSGIVAELGCGTGSLTERLADHGFDMIGIDNSEDMLKIASDKNKNILYLLQDMRSFELYGTCAAIISRCDSLNYITEYEDMIKVFKLVNNYLDPEGIFIFDINAPYKYEQILANNTIAENRDEGSFIWENYYDETTKINEYDLTIYIKDTLGDDIEACRFLRFEETHYQRAYSIEEVKSAAEKAGLLFISVVDADTLKEPCDNTERYLISLKESGKGLKI